ncbi:hypothetical protein [Promicromonospora sp. NPDC023987]|uniref:hypothetical protein n=1 Tax=Promicromonospora sp. NPDC023987 TaxID=3155360 RepID=UPI0033CAF4F5
MRLRSTRAQPRSGRGRWLLTDHDAERAMISQILSQPMASIGKMGVGREEYL